MKILIIGAGPAGLSFAAMAAEADPTHEITLLERNAADARPGFGITLRGDGISWPKLHSINSFQHLEGRSFRYDGNIMVDYPNPPSAHLITVSRAALLTGLTELCLRSGVRVRFQVDAGRLSQTDVDQFDMVVAADGANSVLRTLYQHAFAPLVQHSRNFYGWFGASTALRKLTIMLNDADGVLLAWGYRYTESLSTLIVECSESSMIKLGLAGISPRETSRTIGKVLESDLSGASVDCGNSVRWMKFPQVSCERLRYRNIVLIGDAAHTTHFSQGFGTMFAFDDAQTLCSSLATTRNIPEALELYEASQQPKIIQFQEASSRSMQWSESLIEAAERRNGDKVKELIEARWPKNEAPLCPGVATPNGQLGDRIGQDQP
jgi:anthraniloyl-CoA monooxygenase